MDVKLLRIDSRLVHGQVANNWAGSLGAEAILAVSDGAANDELRKTLMLQTGGGKVKIHVLGVEKAARVYKNPKYEALKAVIVGETPADPGPPPKPAAEFKAELGSARSKPAPASKFSIALSLLARKISLSNAAKIVSLMSLFISSPPPPWLKSIVSFKFFLFVSKFKARIPQPNKPCYFGAAQNFKLNFSPTFFSSVKILEHDLFLKFTLC